MIRFESTGPWVVPAQKALGPEVKSMLDLVFVLLAVLFFAGTWGLVMLFDRLRGE